MKEIDLTKLKEPFHYSDIEWRIQSSGITKDNKVWGKCLAYITSRAVQDRLDEVCGVGNWQNEFKEWHRNSQLCGISIKIGGEWITKWDGSDETAIEGIKGGLSGSMKRAASQWGVGRYLYKLKINWINLHQGGVNSCKINNVFYNWDPPQLPAEYLPKKESV